LRCAPLPLSLHAALPICYARPAGRGGPGAGRPAKRYTAADIDVSAAIPARRYDLAARLFARALAEASADDGAVRAAELAEAEGRDRKSTRLNSSHLGSA